MRYMRAYQFMFESPKWMTNLLFAGLCMMIPVIGPIVISGWLYEVVEAIQRRGERAYPDFDFGRFSQYLSRGVWPFLVSLALSLVLMPLAIAFMVVFMIVIASSGGKPDMGVIVGLQIGYMVLMVVAGLLLSLISTPIMLRAGLMQEFKAAFNMAFVRDFVKKMWKETLLVQLFLMVSSMVVALAGFMLFCVGIIPAQALIVMAQAHLIEQLYSRYLERGGIAIPLKMEAPIAMPEQGDVEPA